MMMPMPPMTSTNIQITPTPAVFNKNGGDNQEKNEWRSASIRRSKKPVLATIPGIVKIKRRWNFNFYFPSVRKCDFFFLYFRRTPLFNE